VDTISPHPPPEHLHQIIEITGLTAALAAEQKKVAAQGEEIKALRAYTEKTRNGLGILYVLLFALMVVLLLAAMMR
jgi:hypothetical protein